MSESPRESSSDENVRTGTVEPAEAETARPLLGKLIAVVVALGCAVYLANIGFGIVGEVPDVWPVIGNLDEATAVAILISSLAYLGIRLPFLSALSGRPKR